MLPASPDLLLILIILFCSSLIRSTFGFGDAVIAMPLLALVVDLRVATPLVALIAFTLGILILLGNFRHIEIRCAWRLILSSAFGIPIGLLLLKASFENILKIVLAILIMAFALYQLIQPRLSIIRQRNAFLFGFIAGILGGAYNTNGPPVIVYGTLRRWTPQSFRATLQGYFVTTSLFILAGHALGGLWTTEVLQSYLMAIPLVLIAIFGGQYLHRRIPAEKFNKYIYGLLTCIGLSLLIQSTIRLLG